uniref:Uncharacterized protein n=1 Tax=Maylandia zebra TaxID=106582 RepID=A0A3P9BWB3_9CICH
MEGFTPSPRSKPRVGPSVGELIVKAVAAFKERNGVPRPLSSRLWMWTRTKPVSRPPSKAWWRTALWYRPGASGSFKMNKATETKAKTPVAAKKPRNRQDLLEVSQESSSSTTSATASEDNKMRTRGCGVGEVAKTTETLGGRAFSSPQAVLAVTKNQHPYGRTTSVDSCQQG